MSARDDKRRRQREAREQRKAAQAHPARLFGGAELAPMMPSGDPGLPVSVCVITLGDVSELEGLTAELRRRGIDSPVRLAALVMAPYDEIAPAFGSEERQ